MATDGNIKDDCPVTLQEDWRCCPLCGRKTAALFLEGVRFNVDAEAPKNLPLKVRLQGRVPLYGRLEFEPDSIVKSDSAGFLLDEARPSVNVLLTVPATSKMTLGNVYLCARNGRRDRNAEAAWDANGVLERQQHILRLIPQQKGCVEPDETLLIFRQSTLERILHLRNTGAEAAQDSLALEKRLDGGAETLLSPANLWIWDILDRDVYAAPALPVGWQEIPENEAKPLTQISEELIRYRRFLVQRLDSRYSVKRMETLPNQTWFDTALHRADEFSKVKTTDPALNLLIASVRAAGFTRNGEILRKPQVTYYFYTAEASASLLPPQDSPADSAPLPDAQMPSFTIPIPPSADDSLMTVAAPVSSDPMADFAPPNLAAPSAQPQAETLTTFRHMFSLTCSNRETLFGSWQPLLAE